MSLCVGHREKLCIFLLQAFSAFYYVMEFLNFTSGETPSQEKVMDKMKEFCSLRWEEVCPSLISHRPGPAGKTRCRIRGPGSSLRKDCIWQKF